MVIYIVYVHGSGQPYSKCNQVHYVHTTFAQGSGVEDDGGKNGPHPPIGALRCKRWME